VNATDKKFKCKECSYVSPYKQALMRHVKAVHLKIKDMICKECNATFSCKANLIQHIKTVHQTIKDHTCHLCGYASFRKYNLRKHIERVHREKKVNKSNYSPPNLNVNFEYVDSGIDVQECYHCGYISSDMVTFKEHMQSVHEQINAPQGSDQNRDHSYD
jgi:KRAB domain-containing zinc finger protein